MKSDAAIFVTGAVLVLLLIGFIITRSQSFVDTETSDCAQRGGVLLDTRRTGWVCIKREDVLQ